MAAEKLTERWKMARKTAGHAKENLLKEKSECSWEFDAWRDLFSKIRDNSLLAMSVKLFQPVKRGYSLTYGTGTSTGLTFSKRKIWAYVKMEIKTSPLENMLFFQPAHQTVHLDSRQQARMKFIGTIRTKTTIQF